MVEIECVVDAACYLGEGPVWDPVDQDLYWVDIKGPKIWRLHPDSGETATWTLPTDVTALALRERGGAVVALRDGFYFFDFASGACDLIAKVDEDKPRVRMNDGKVDRRGRFFVGGEDEPEEFAIASLYRLDPDLTVHNLEFGIICNNGPCWSPDDKTFYHTDTFKQEIYAYDYDIDTGAIANKRVFVSTAEQPGCADGSTIDSEGYLWNAQVIGGRLMRYTPDGAIDREIEMPVRNITSVMFGGEKLDVLYVTSMARVDHPGAKEHFVAETRAQSHAGGLFAVRGLGVTGLPEPRFAG